MAAAPWPPGPLGHHAAAAGAARRAARGPHCFPACCPEQRWQKHRTFSFPGRFAVRFFFFLILLSQGICGKMLPCLKFVAFASAAAPVGGSQLLIYAYPHRDIKNNRSVETRQWDFNSLGQGPRSVHVHLPPIYVCVFNGKVCQGVLSWFSWDSALYKYLSSHRIPNNFLEKLPLWRGSK